MNLYVLLYSFTYFSRQNTVRDINHSIHAVHVASNLSYSDGDRINDNVLSHASVCTVAARELFICEGLKIIISIRGVARILVRGGGEGQTKLPVMSQKFRFEAVTISKNLLNKDFFLNLKI